MSLILDFSFEELKNYLISLGEPGYRAGQIYSAICSGKEISEITNISKSLRSDLQNEFGDAFPSLISRLVSSDGTEKYLFAMQDGEMIETVFMSYEYGNSVCVSTQSGCNMGCRFCASTLLGKKRDLSSGEILGQVIAAERITGKKVNHVVMMGIGEPLENYDNSLKFIRSVTSVEGKHLSARNISLSTCGIVPGIDRLSEENIPLTLSVSLHASNNTKRSELMPINRKYNLDTLLDSCRRYFDKTKRRISFEYSLISGVNDSRDDAKELSSLLLRYFPHPIPFHVNLIPVNNVEERSFNPSDKKAVERFVFFLSEEGINATVRRKLGNDISASCGQLRYRKLK